MKKLLVNIKENISYDISYFLAMIAYWIVKNITKDTRLTILEMFLALSPRYGFMYCRDYLQGRFERGEELILQTGYEYVYKKLDLERRLPNPDDQLFKNAEKIIDLPNIFFNNKKHHIIFDDIEAYIKIYYSILDIVVIKEESIFNTRDILFLHNAHVKQLRFDEFLYSGNFSVYSIIYLTREHMEEGYVLLKLSRINYDNWK